MNKTEQSIQTTVEVVIVEQPKQEAPQVTPAPALALKTGIRAGFANKRSSDM